jgi:hypothetical protein
MKLSNVAVLTCALLFVLAPSVFAQKFSQPYTIPRGAHESRVVSCSNPNPQTSWKIAADDFVCPTASTIVRVCWFGVVSSPAQLNPPPAGALPRRYVIRIYNQLPTICKPNNVLFTQCVIPSNTTWSTDCLGRVVYRFSAPLSPGFPAAANTKYWLQVSEEDARSATQNAEDFRWSGHRPSTTIPHNLCPAVQRLGPAPTWICPISDDCPNPVEDDLAFCLYRQTISGIITLTGVVQPAVFNLELSDAAGNLVETMSVRTDDGGAYAVESEAPEGTYHMMLTGMGIHPVGAIVNVADGTEAPASFFDIFYGDLDNNGSIDLGDYARLQNGFTGP